MDSGGRCGSLVARVDMEVTDGSKIDIEGWSGRRPVRSFLSAIYCGPFTSPRSRCYSYLLNPYVALPSLAFSTSSFENALALVSLMFACRGTRTSRVYCVCTMLILTLGRASAALLNLACLVQLSLPSVLLVAPVILLAITRPTSRLALPRPFDGNWRRALPLLAEFLGYTALLTFASTLVCGNWLWIEKTWGAL